MQEGSKNKKKILFSYGEFNQYTVEFDSDYDGGNLDKVIQISSSCYKICGANDMDNFYGKSCFNFQVQGFLPGMRIKFIINKINILANYYSLELENFKKNETSYQVCYKKGGDEWQRSTEISYLYMNRDQQLQLSFSHTFWENVPYCFAFCFPYSYSKYLQYVATMTQKYKDHKSIYLNQQTLILSVQQRPIMMLTISSLRDTLPNERQEHIQGLFPFRQTQLRPYKFKNTKKPYIFISGRVHPAQTPSSFTVEGIINFILNENDLRSYLLRQMFIIVIVPMLNPDGVYNGNFRYDSKNQNLNRYYQTATRQEQPSIFATKSVLQKMASQKRLMYYFDLHAHHSPKGCFIYGNAYQDFVKLIEGRVFCRAMSINSSSFEYSACNFDKKHMALKQKNDKYSKEGCGRVFAYKLTENVHCYTVECGYYYMGNNNKIDVSNTGFCVNSFGYTSGQTQSDQILRISSYKQIGRNLMITILDSLQLNPYSKIEKSPFKDIDNLRKITSFQVFHQEERFRKFEPNIYKRIRNINTHIQQIYEEWFAIRKQIKLEESLLELRWPECFNKSRFENINSPAKKKSKEKLKINISIHKVKSTKQKKQKIQQNNQDIETERFSPLSPVSSFNPITKTKSITYQDQSDCSIEKERGRKFSISRKVSMVKQILKTQVPQSPIKAQEREQINTRKGLKTQFEQQKVDLKEKIDIKEKLEIKTFQIKLKQVRIQNFQQPQLITRNKTKQTQALAQQNFQLMINNREAKAYTTKLQSYTNLSIQNGNRQSNKIKQQSQKQIPSSKGSQYQDHMIASKRYQKLRKITPESPMVLDTSNITIKFPKIQNLTSIKASIIKDLKKDTSYFKNYYRK